MTGFLLDTNVLSEIVKKRPSERVVSRLRSQPADALFVSSISVMELRFGAARHPGGTELWKRIEREALSRVRLIPIGGEEAARAGEILAELEAQGTPIGLEDTLIGATALVHGLKVATRNVRHLSRIRDLAVEDWWT